MKSTLISYPYLLLLICLFLGHILFQNLSLNCYTEYIMPDNGIKY